MPRRSDPRSLAVWLAALVAVAVLASTALTAGALARALGAANRDQAAAALVAEADTLNAFAEQGSRLRLAARIRVVNARVGWSAQVVGRGQPPREPFGAIDVTGVPDSEPVARSVDGVSWLVLVRPASAAPGDGRDSTVLVARRLAQASRLSPDQRRSLLVAALAGLGAGFGAALLVAGRISAPLRRLSASAAALARGERELDVPHQGPAEVVRVAAALEALAGDLDLAERRRRSFLLAVSHELRTPMTVVAGYAEMLSDHVLPPEQVPPAAAVIAAESARLQRRVADLLALARLEAEDFTLEARPTDVAAILGAAAVAATPAAEAAGVRLQVRTQQALRPLVTDGERLRQMVDALVDNAVRALEGTPDGRVVLTATVDPDGAVRVEVGDNGPGLAADDLAVAFEAGLLSERYRGRRRVGAGVGLALVGELARRLGGHAEACPAAGGGVVFAVVLPDARTLP